jgi:hypothetical protein
MMEQVKLSLAEQLKNEVMERYGLREDQVRLEISISTTDLDLGREILKDFNTKYPSSNKYLPEGANCDSVYGLDVGFVSVHRKDGFHGQYLFEDDNE